MYSKNYQNQNNDQNQNSSNTLNPGSNSNKQAKATIKTKNNLIFIIYKKLPRWLRKTPSGNFLHATSLGMEIVEPSPTMCAEMFGGENGGSIESPSGILPPTWAYGDTLWVPQDGATGVAIPGAYNLAKKIYLFWMAQSISSSSSSSIPPFERKLSVCVPGTCKA